MKTKTLSLLAILSLTAFPAMAATQSVPFTDDSTYFSSGTGAWFGTYTGATQPTLSTVNDAALGGYALQVATPTSSFKGAATTFTNTTLAAGQTLDLTFDMNFTTTPAANGGGLRIGLGNFNGTTGSTSEYATGYSVEIPTSEATDPTALNVITATGAGLVYGSTSISSPTNTIASISTTAEQIISFQVTYVGLVSGTNEYSLAAYLNGNLIASGTDTNYNSTNPFNYLTIAEGSDTTTYDLTNVSLSVVPEPSTLALAGLFSVGMLLLFRRRQNHQA